MTIQNNTRQAKTRQDNRRQHRHQHSKTQVERLFRKSVYISLSFCESICCCVMSCVQLCYVVLNCVSCQVVSSLLFSCRRFLLSTRLISELGGEGWKLDYLCFHLSLCSWSGLSLSWSVLLLCCMSCPVLTRLRLWLCAAASRLVLVLGYLCFIYSKKSEEINQNRKWLNSRVG
jgi:hypothetical protein